MASSVNYGMGQLRYTDSSSYMTDKNFSFKPTKTLVTTSENTQEGADAEYYQDVYLGLENANFSFVAGVPYLLHLDIPKDVSYDCIYQIKMIEEPKDLIIDNANLAYQMIKYITVPKSVGQGTTSRVLIYPVKTDNTPGINEDQTYNTKVAIAKTLNENPATNDVIFDESTGKYYLYNGDEDGEGQPIIGNSKEIENKNDSIMEHTWVTSDITTETVGFNIIFTPRSQTVTYKGILIQMQRSTLDYDIYSETKQIYGRILNIDNPGWKAKVYELTNVVGNAIKFSKLVNIGVYSHPNLLMAINGEEIRVGQSGYYELNDFDITSLAFAANDINDKFTLDYQYIIEN